MNDVKLSQKDEVNCVVPVAETPNAVGENVDFDSQPPVTVTMVTEQLNQVTIDSESSPKTPNDGVFDPFAPGRYENMPRGAPNSNKFTNELRNAVVRQLNFLHLAPSQPQEELNVSDAQFSDDNDDCRTPSSPILRFSADDDTCPGAPLNLKHPVKARTIQPALCKKLDF